MLSGKKAPAKKAPAKKTAAKKAPAKKTAAKKAPAKKTRRRRRPSVAKRSDDYGHHPKKPGPRARASSRVRSRG